MKRNKTVDEFIDSNEMWNKELVLLRKILQSTGMEETIKWGFPVYTFEGKNIVGLGSFKSYVGLWFYQGVFLKDKHKKLQNAQEGKTKAMRQWRFSNAKEIDKKLVLEYLAEAIENQKQGKEVKVERNKPINIPSKLEAAFKEDKILKKQFDALSLGKRRDFAEYIDAAKREATKDKRLLKIIPMIKELKGLNDQYK